MSSEIDSILDSIKKMLGLVPEVVHEFDHDIILSINMAFGILTQIGVGPQQGFAITGESETWNDFLPELEHDKRMVMVKNYVYIKTRLFFDPPQNSLLITSLENQANELEWRLNVQVETPTSFSGAGG